LYRASKILYICNMVIQRAEIKRFRGFQDVTFTLGTQLTVIAGQNGTQKTTILGMLTQPFTITDTSNPMKDEKPLSGGSFKSAFSEKFKLSEKFDQPKSHEWTLHIKGENPFVISSMKRAKGVDTVRFWRKNNREKGSGYIQLPVIFLSLKRLLPIGEDSDLEESSIHALTADEITFFKDWHSKILISMDEITDANYLESPDKNTLGINTEFYDWRLNSAGQDNIGKILLAILSFRRLSKQYPNDYIGGILAIDELDATLYPGSQIQLFDALRTFASKFKLQIIFTTHSLTVLEHAIELSERNNHVLATKDQVKVIYLEKINSTVKIRENISIQAIRHRLNVSIEGKKPVKIRAFVEDLEGKIFVKAILKSKASHLSFINATFGCSSLIELGAKKIPAFSFPESVVFLDGDVRNNSSLMKKLKNLPNYLILPGNSSPERLIADFLFQLPDDSPVWGSIHADYTKQLCFRDVKLKDIQIDREKAKYWFNSQSGMWGSNASKVFKPWIEANQQEVDEFVTNYIEIYNKFAVELSFEALSY
jgi:AAA15 family ATPase/GTPase